MQQEGELTQIFDRITDGFFALDQNWNFTLINKSAEKYGFPSDESARGESVYQFFPMLKGSIFEQNYQQAITTQEPVRFEAYSRGINKWVEVTAYPSAEGLSVYFRDISARKKATEALKKSEVKFAQAFNAMPVMAGIVSLTRMHYIEVNNALTTGTGYAREEIIGRDVRKFSILGYSAEFKEIFASLLSGQIISKREIVFWTKTGQQRFGLISIDFIEIENEECILGVIQDITEIKLYQKEMANLERLRLIGKMSAGLAHEIRNPLTTVKGFLQLMTADQSLVGDKKYLNLMIEEINRATGILNEFLSLARDKPLETSSQDLNEIIKKIFPLIYADALMADKSIRLELAVIPKLLLDENEIRQLLYNLIRNALEAIDTHGEVLVRTYQRGAEVGLEIQDQGGGIPTEHLDKIGTPFFSTKEKGSGLGLAACYSIVRRHQAEMSFDTGPTGTTFSVKFKTGLDNKPV